MFTFLCPGLRHHRGHLCQWRVHPHQYRPADNLLMVDLMGVSAAKWDGKMREVHGVGLRSPIASLPPRLPAAPMWRLRGEM